MRLDAMGLGNVLSDEVRQQTAPLLSEAVSQYLQLKGIGKAKTFHQATPRNAGVVIDQLGDRQIQQSCIQHDDDMRWLIALKIRHRDETIRSSWTTHQ